MVLAEALCAMSLAANSIRDGLCCFYQMKHDSKRQETTELVIRKAVRDEIHSQKYDSTNFHNRNKHCCDQASSFTGHNEDDNGNTSLSSSFVNTCQEEPSRQHCPQQRNPWSSLVSPIPTTSSMLEDSEHSINKNHWIHARDASFVSIRIE